MADGHKGQALGMHFFLFTVFSSNNLIELMCCILGLGYLCVNMCKEMTVNSLLEPD